MDLRKVLLGWLAYVPVTTVVYALVFNGKFSAGGQLPVWLIATTSVMAVAAIAILLHWVRAAATGQITHDQMTEAAAFFWMIAITGAVGDILAVAAEIAFGAAALWLMIPTATITYALCVAWIYPRLSQFLVTV